MHLALAVAAIACGTARPSPETAAPHDDQSTAVWGELTDEIPSARHGPPPVRPDIDPSRAPTIARAIGTHADPARGIYVRLASAWGVMTTCGVIGVRRRACSATTTAAVARAVVASLDDGAAWECGAGVCRVPIAGCGPALCALRSGCTEDVPNGGAYGEGTLAILFEGTADAPTITGVAFECEGWIDLDAEEAAARACDDDTAWR